MSAINFKNGDEVQISDESEYRYQGIDDGGEKMRGVISPNSNGWYTVTWDDGSSNSYRDEDLEPYGATKSSHSFELNERVIVCEGGFGFGKSEVGKEFIIVEFGDYGGDPGVKLRDAETNTIHPNSHFNDFVGIKSIKKMESRIETQRKFKVGDTVVGNSKATDRYCITQAGWRGKVTKVNSDFFIAEGRGSTGDIAEFDLQYEYFDLAQSEPEPLEPQRKFKVGDEVVGNADANTYGITVQGWRGKVISLGFTFFDAQDFNGTKFHGLSYDCFDLAQSEPEPSELPKRKFEVGDKVTYKYQKDLLGSCYRYGGPCQGGYVGTIKSIERDDSLNVTTESGLVYHMSPDEFVEYDGVAIKPADEAFLAEANRRYPIGTLYKELNDVGEVTGALREASEEAMWVVRGESIEVGYGYVYVNGRWADVVPETKYVVTQRIPSTKQLPASQTPIIMSRSKNKNKIKVL